MLLRKANRRCRAGTQHKEPGRCRSGNLAPISINLRDRQRGENRTYYLQGLNQPETTGSTIAHRSEGSCISVSFYHNESSLHTTTPSLLIAISLYSRKDIAHSLYRYSRKGTTEQKLPRTKRGQAHSLHTTAASLRAFGDVL